jgi:hypothetical protein
MILNNLHLSPSFFSARAYALSEVVGSKGVPFFGILDVSVLINPLQTGSKLFHSRSLK